jgi:uncharacterized membrane protein YdjX (TVP38/TMEM64 family)
MSSQMSALLRNRSGVVTVLSAAMLLVALLLLARAVPLDRLLPWLDVQVRALGLWGPALFVAVLLVAAVVLLPITPIVWAAGALFGPLGGMAVASTATTGAAAVSFLLGRCLGQASAAQGAGRYRRLAALYHAVGESGWKVVMVVRLSHALPFGVQSFFFGMTSIRFFPYLVATWLAMLPGALLHAYLGAQVARALEEAGGTAPPTSAGEWALRGLLVVGVASAVLYIGRLVRTALLHSTAHDSREGEAPAELATREGKAPAEPMIPEPAGWPWGPTLMLLTSALVLGLALWGWLRPEGMRQVIGGP